MPRTLSSTLQSLLAQSNPATRHLLSFTAVGTTYYFADDQVTFQGHLHQPWLVLDSAIRYTQQLQLDPVTVRLQNITLEMAELLKSSSDDIQGAEARLQRLYLPASEAVTLFVGRIAQIAVDDQTATIQLAGDLDPTASQVPRRKYSATCAWDFKDADCGYTTNDPVDPATNLPFTACPKDFLSCQARGRQHRFSGFIHISRDVTLSVEGQLSSQPSTTRTLSELIRPWEEQ